MEVRDRVGQVYGGLDVDKVGEPVGAGTDAGWFQRRTPLGASRRLVIQALRITMCKFFAAFAPLLHRSQISSLHSLAQKLAQDEAYLFEERLLGDLCV